MRRLNKRPRRDVSGAIGLGLVRDKDKLSGRECEISVVPSHITYMVHKLVHPR